MSEKNALKPTPLEAWEEVHTLAGDLFDGILPVANVSEKLRESMVILKSRIAMTDQRNRQVAERDCAWNLIALVERLLEAQRLFHKWGMQDEEGICKTEEVLKRAKELWYPKE